MGLSIRNRETEAKARKLARLTGQGITQAIDDALSSEIRRIEAVPRNALPSIEAATLKLDRWLSLHPQSGPDADKAFFDALDDD